MLNCARIIIDRKTMRARNRCFSLRHRRAFGEESGRRRQGEHDSCVCRRTKEIDRVRVGEFCVCVLNTVSEYNCVAFNSKEEYWLFSPAFFSKISFVTAHVSFYFQIPIHSNPRYVIRIMSLELNAVHHNDHPLCSSSSFSSFSSLLFPPSPSPRKKNRRPLHGRFLGV